MTLESLPAVPDDADDIDLGQEAPGDAQLDLLGDLDGWAEYGPPSIDVDDGQVSGISGSTWSLIPQPRVGQVAAPGGQSDTGGSGQEVGVDLLGLFDVGQAAAGQVSDGQDIPVGEAFVVITPGVHQPTAGEAADPRLLPLG